jgi:hypothetical protein
MILYKLTPAPGSYIRLASLVVRSSSENGARSLAARYAEQHAEDAEVWRDAARCPCVALDVDGAAEVVAVSFAAVNPYRYALVHKLVNTVAADARQSIALVEILRLVRQELGENQPFSE